MVEEAYRWRSGLIRPYRKNLPLPWWKQPEQPRHDRQFFRLFASADTPFPLAQRPALC